MSLATDACLTADPGVASWIWALSHTFVEIYHEIISRVILLPSADAFKKGCCQLQAKVCAKITGYLLVQACPRKSVVRWTDCPAMTIANKQFYLWCIFQDPGISSTQPSGTYPPWDDGLNKNCFIKKFDGSGPIIGKVSLTYKGSLNV